MILLVETTETLILMQQRHLGSPWFFSGCLSTVSVCWLCHLRMEHFIISRCWGWSFLFYLAELYLETLGILGRLVGPKRKEEISGHIFVTSLPIVPSRMLSASFVSGIAWGMILRFLSSVCLEKGDSLLQSSVFEDLVPSYGEGSTLPYRAEEQQSRVLAKRYWLSKFKQSRLWTPQTQDSVT